MTHRERSSWEPRELPLQPPLSVAVSRAWLQARVRRGRVTAIESRKTTHLTRSLSNGPSSSSTTQGELLAAQLGRLAPGTCCSTPLGSSPWRSCERARNGEEEGLPPASGRFGRARIASGKREARVIARPRVTGTGDRSASAFSEAGVSMDMAGGGGCVAARSRAAPLPKLLAALG